MTPGYKPQLDGLRAIAVAAVAWSHWERGLQFGVPFGAGVHLFYVLSGFLITGILLQVRATPRPLATIRAFYARRALRIFPAFYLTLALAWLAGVPGLDQTLAWHAAYLSNVLIFVTGDWQGSLSHLWSLAVEEQFYLVWPWIVLFVPRRLLLVAVLAAIAAAPAWRAWLALDGYRESMLAVLTPGSLDSLGMGALLAVLTSETRNEGRWSSNWHRLTAAAFIVWVALVASGEYLPAWLVALKQTIQAVVFAGVVYGAAVGFGGWAGRILAVRPMVYVGRISYGIYLAHGLAGELLAAAGVSSRAVPEPLRFVLLAAVTVGVASLSWHLVEAPINALKSRVPYVGAARCGSRRPSPADIAP